jgi:hypothetical protein
MDLLVQSIDFRISSTLHHGLDLVLARVTTHCGVCQAFPGGGYALFQQGINDNLVFHQSRFNHNFFDVMWVDVSEVNIGHELFANVRSIGIDAPVIGPPTHQLLEEK